MNPMNYRWQQVPCGRSRFMQQINPLSSAHRSVRQADGGRALQRLAAVLSLLVLILSLGCAASSEVKDKGFTTERLLVAAGFKFKEAQTPEQFEQLKALPQEKLMRHEMEGEMLYLYASAKGCRCLYAGDEEAYSKFRTLHRDAKLNAKLRKGLWSQGDLWESGQDWGSYINDLDSGMIPGY
jgi:hypothetical protein